MLKQTFNPLTGNFDLVSEVELDNVGSSPNADGATLVDQVLQLQPADDSNPGLLTATSQSIGGDKTFTDDVLVEGVVDAVATGGTDTLNIGTGNADIINIGHAAATVNVQGTLMYQDVVNLDVTDKNITVNAGGSAGSGNSAGLGINENNVITGYAQTSSDRNSWELKAPNTAGVATITPGAGGIVIDQSSHSAVSLTAVGSSPNADGASLSGQALTLQPADGTNPGLLTSGAQTIGGAKTFSSTISASNLSGTNTGDVTLAAVGSSPNANGASLSGQILNLQPADGSNPGVVTTGAQTIAGVKTFSSAPNLSSLTASLPLKLDGSKNITAAAISLSGAEVTGVLPVAKGGLNTDGNDNSSYINTAGTSIGSGGAAVIPWPTAVYDPGSRVSSDAYTVVVGGLYLVIASVGFDSNSWSASNIIDLGVVVNSSTYRSLSQVSIDGAITAQVGTSGSAVISLSPGDTVEINVFHNRSGGSASLTTDPRYNFWQMTKVG